MPKLKPQSGLFRFFTDVDSIISSSVFEAMDWTKRNYSAYSAWMTRWRIWGFKRLVVDFFSEGATIGLVVAIGFAYYALPPFSGEGDIWNRGRQYAITFTDQNGEVIGQRGVRQDDAIPLNEIPKHMVNAVLATEDSRFYSHFGVDPQGTLRAAIVNATGSGRLQGGSTLTQQLAKNLFLSPERSLRRKVHEAFLALWIEARLSKDDILKLYLDRSYMGGGTYGVEAAAQFYFGKSIRDVNLQEGAMLAGLFKAPSKYAPHVNIEAARARANVVLYRMIDDGFISQGELFAARREPANVATPPGYYSPDYFLDWAYEETLGTLKEQGLSGEYVIEVQTTIDQALQKHAQQTINNMLDENGKIKRVKQAALVTMTPKGAVKAIVGGRDYELSQFNRATEALRQPGSSFKPFVYLAALRSGLRPQSQVVDAPITIRGWSPKNYNRRYRGRVTLTRALQHSINTVPVHIAQAIGRKSIIEAARLVGLDSELRPNPSMPLGTNEVTVMDITGAYATFANGGRLTKPHAVLEIRRPNGDLLYSRSSNERDTKQAVSPGNIADLNYMLNQVVLHGTGRRSALGFTPQAGKTGTTQGYRDAWFIGFTNHFVTGVWYGNDDYTPTNRLTGGNLPAMTWKAVMAKALETQVAEALPGVPLDGRYAKYTNNNDVEIPLASLQQQALERAQAEQATEVSIVTSETSETPGTSEDADERPRSGAVVSAVRDIFSLFGRQEQRQRSSNVRTVTIETRQKRREKRVKTRRQRSRDQQRQRLDNR